MKEFIHKWSNWWILQPKRKQLDDAFEKELNELIEREVALHIHDVSNRRELLCAFFKYFRDNGEANIGMTIEEFVDGFLTNTNMSIEEQNPASCQTAVSSRFFIPESAQQWLLKGDRGISSETIFGAITGLNINSSKYPPADPSDFYRCYKLIKAVPEWKEELYKVAELSKTWKNVVDNWDKLSELLEEQIEWRDKGISASNGMYDFMKQLGC